VSLGIAKVLADRLSDTALRAACRSWLAILKAMMALVARYDRADEINAILVEIADRFEDALRLMLLCGQRSRGGFHSEDEF